NMGKVRLSDSMESDISHMEMVMYLSKKSPINGGMIALEDALVITFTRVIQEADIIRAFFRELSATYNLTIEVYSNDSRRKPCNSIVPNVIFIRNNNIAHYVQIDFRRRQKRMRIILFMKQTIKSVASPRGLFYLL